MGSISRKYSENSKNIILKTPDTKYVPDPDGMGVLFYNKMKSYGNAIAQIDSVTGEKDTYASLLQRSVRTAVKMRSLGVTASDVVTICSVNHLNSCVPLVASLFLGAKTANLDPAISVEETSRLVQYVSPKIIFVGEEAVDLIETATRLVKLNTTIVVFGKSTVHLTYSSFLLPFDGESTFEPVKVNNKDTAVIYFSSGTTGLPKGICLSHRGITGMADLVCNHLGLCMDVILGYATLYWIASIGFITRAILNKKCRIICPSFNPHDIWYLIEKYKVTFILLNAFQAIQVYRAGRPPNVNTSCLKQLLMAGAVISKEVVEGLRSILPDTDVFTVYGQTEFCGAISCFKLNMSDEFQFMRERITACGKIIDGVTYKVVDPETEQTLGPFQKGELRLKGIYQMNGYYNMDSSQAWDDEGYLKTGDIVYYDEDYCIYVIDRIKDILKYQMWHISPAFLEGVLLTHPAVQSAAVVGLPHPVDGDHPMGIVVLNDSYSGKITSCELQSFVDKQVDEKQKLRGGVKIVLRIPYTHSGKLQRNYIRDMTLSGKLC